MSSVDSGVVKGKDKDNVSSTAIVDSTHCAVEINLEPKNAQAWSHVKIRAEGTVSKQDSDGISKPVQA